MKTKVSRRTVWAFVRYLEESAVSVVDYADIIIQLCENVLHMEIEDLRKQWGIEDEISKLIISLYDETVNSSKTTDKQIADKCLNLCAAGSSPPESVRPLGGTSRLYALASRVILSNKITTSCLCSTRRFALSNTISDTLL